ncbi:MAG: hypothetical protein E7446_04935 [Ruminococcaceae bacterium]|nr:hypothetical protein [Oscillospiraceae bacterium]
MMKRMKKTITCLTLALLLVVSLLPVQAHAADASLSASASTLRAGNSFEVYFTVSGSNILGIEGSVDYDSSALTFGGMADNTGSNWSMSQSGNYFTMYNTDESSPINGSATVLILYFTVNSGAAAGANLSVSVSGAASTGAEESGLYASWSNTVAAPLSGNANLDGLWCSQAELGFNGSTEYSITVPYDVSELSIDYSTEHGGAWAEISGTWLSVGSNTVTVTVYAENGATKRYYIYATREQDPNYVPSSDAALSSLEVSAGTLSPAFSPDVKEYVVYLPYETDKLQLSGTARDSKAKSVQQIGSNVLKEGENLLTMQCVAEDDTVMEYKVHAIRMPLFAGELPEIIPPVTETLTPADPVEPTPPPEPEIPTMELPLLVELPYIGEVSIWWVAGAALLLVLVILWLIAWAIGRRGGHRKALRELAVAAPTEETPLLERLAADDTASPTEDDAAEEKTLMEEAPSIEEAAPVEEDSTQECAEEIAPAAETLPVEEAAPSAEETLTKEDPPVADSPAEEDVPVTEESPAEEEPLTEEESLIENTPAEEGIKEQAAEETTAEKEAEDVVNTMSLSDLLEDIRNM